MTKTLVFLIIMCLLPFSCFAEIYRNIGCFDTLGDIKARFPNANFKRSFPAWAQESDVLYQVTGQGISGTIVIKFNDNRPEYRRMLAMEADPKMKEVFEKLANLSDDDIGVDWVRWIPAYPLPLQRLISKYGKPDKSGFSDDDLHPYKVWTKAGVEAYLSDDGNKVVSIDYSYTKTEIQQAWKKSFNFIPESLK